MNENMRKLLQLASEMGIDAEYKHAPEGADIDTWDMLEKPSPQYDKEGNLKRAIKPFANRNNLAVILENDPEFATLCFNDHANKIKWNGEELWDPHLEDIGLHVERCYRIKYPSHDIKRAVLRVAYQNIEEPIKDYLNSLKWDGSHRIDDLFEVVFRAQVIKGSKQLIREMSRKWVLSLVARIIYPGCKMDTFLVLCGEKGLGKSTALKTLIGEAWFADSPLDISKKDSLELIHSSETWLWELAELHSLQGRTADNFKAFISSASDKFRPSYQQFPKSYQRRVVFAGTSNNYQFLSDGPERRVWPITCTGSIDTDYLRTWRDQIFAEAMEALRDREIWHLERDSQAMLSHLQQAYIIDDPWALQVRDAIVSGKNTTSMIMREIELPVSQQHSGNARRIAQIARDYGYEQVVSEGTRVWRLK